MLFTIIKMGIDLEIKMKSKYACVHIWHIHVCLWFQRTYHGLTDPIYDPSADHEEVPCASYELHVVSITVSHTINSKQLIVRHKWVKHSQIF